MRPQLQTPTPPSHAAMAALPDLDDGLTHTKGDASPLPVCLLVDRDVRGDLSPLLMRSDATWLHASSAASALLLMRGQAHIALACIDSGSTGADTALLAEELGRQGAAVLLLADGDAPLHAPLPLHDNAMPISVLPRPLAAGVLEARIQQALQLHAQQQSLLQQRRACDDAMRLNAMVADVLGHDLRSPLSAILMSAEILKRRPEEALQKTGARLARSASWMGRMVQDMLDLTRSQLGLGLQLKPEPTDLSALLQSVLDERAAGFPQQHTTALQQGDLLGVWDTTRLRQLLSSLLGNALHHGEPGQPVSVQVDGQAADTVRITLRNHGAIDADLLPRLFDPLHAGARRPSPPEGLGFGLYIARQIARGHGGELTLQSDARNGTLVQVTLPRVMPMSPEPSTTFPTTALS